MKRELKVQTCPFYSSIAAPVAKPIPMKRELKGSVQGVEMTKDELGCKANPDEKGTERYSLFVGHNKPYRSVAKPIPMKRELKVVYHIPRYHNVLTRLQSQSR